MTEAQWRLIKASLEHLEAVMVERRDTYLSYKIDKEYWKGRADECDWARDEIRHVLNRAENFDAQ